MNNFNVINKSFPNNSWVMATILEVNGSAYRGEGTEMLIDQNGKTYGEISGGCLENDIVAHARQVLESKKTVLLSYTTGVGEDILWGTGLGCEGKIKIVLEYLDKETKEIYDYVHNCVMERKFVTMLSNYVEGEFRKIVLDSENKVQFTQGLSAGQVNGLVEQAISHIKPDQVNHFISMKNERWGIVNYKRPIQLVIFGAEEDAIPVCKLGSMLDWEVTIVDHRKNFANKEKFPGARNLVCENEIGAIPHLNLDQEAVVLIMTHKYLIDKELFKSTICLELMYLGLLGPRKKGLKMMEELREEGVQIEEDQLEKFHSPMGLDIGGESSSHVALSIISEIQSVLTNRNAGKLKYKRKSIHEREQLIT